MKPRSRFHLLIVLAIIQLMLFAPSITLFAEDTQQALASPILVVNTSFLNIRSGPSASYSIIGTVVGGTELPVLGLYEDEVWYQVATNVGAGWVNRKFTIGRGDFSSVPLIEYGTIASAQAVVPSVATLGQGGGTVVTATTTGTTSTGIGVFGASFIGGDLHTAPDPSSPIVAALLPNDENNVYPVMNIVYYEGRPYYQVNYSTYGVVWSDRFRPRPMECNGWSVISATEYVGTVQLGVSNPIQFSPGDEMYIAGPGRDGMIEIVTQDGSRGLIPVDKTTSRPDTVIDHCELISGVATSVTTTTTTTAASVVVPAVVNVGQGGGVVVPSFTSSARLIVNTGNLNIRTGPGANYSVLATVPGGTELPVLGLYEDEVWYQVVTSLGAGWVNREFTIGRGDFSSVPLIEYGTWTAVQVQSAVTTDVATLGQGGGAVVTAATTGATSTGIGVFGASFIGGDLHTAPDPSSPVVAALLPADENNVYPVMNIVYYEGRPYYQVNYSTYGVVWSDRFRPRPMECNGWSVIYATEPVGTVQLGVSNPIQFSTGNEMYVAGPGRDGMIEIVTQDGSRGLVPVDKTSSRPDTVIDHCELISGVAASVTTASASTVIPSVINVGQGGGVVPPTTSAARLIVNTGNLNIRTGPGANYTVLATVPGGTELPVTGLYEDEVWYQVATNIGYGWVNREYTIGRGDFSNVPLIKYGAFTPSVSNGTTSAGVVNVTVASATVNSAARVVVNTPNLNVRTGPSALFSVVATVSGGTELAVLGVADDGVWYLVEGTFGQGWLNNEFVIFRGDYSAVPVLNINP